MTGTKKRALEAVGQEFWMNCVFNMLLSMSRENSIISMQPDVFSGRILALADMMLRGFQARFPIEAVDLPKEPS